MDYFWLIQDESKKKILLLTTTINLIDILKHNLTSSYILISKHKYFKQNTGHTCGYSESQMFKAISRPSVLSIWLYIDSEREHSEINKYSSFINNIKLACYYEWYYSKSHLTYRYPHILRWIFWWEIAQWGLQTNKYNTLFASLTNRPYKHDRILCIQSQVQFCAHLTSQHFLLQAAEHWPQLCADFHPSLCCPTEDLVWPEQPFHLVNPVNVSSV